jgi:hypothetical protein
LLDWRGQKDLRDYTENRDFEAVAGVAKIEWKSKDDRDACIADHEKETKRERRWSGVMQSMDRMKAGEFPQFAHAYLHPSLTDREGLIVIDGTRRMLAYLELGRAEMPVVVFRTASRG